MNSSIQLSNGPNIPTAGRPPETISRSDVNNDDSSQSRINSDKAHPSNSSPDSTFLKIDEAEKCPSNTVEGGDEKEDKHSQINAENNRISSVTADNCTLVASSCSNPSATPNQESAANSQNSESNCQSFDSLSQSTGIESIHPNEPSDATAQSSTSEINSSQVSSETCADNNEPRPEDEKEKVKCENSQGNHDENSLKKDSLASTCEEIESNSDFSAVCDFFIQFGEKLGISYSIADLKEMLEEKEFVHEELIELHIKLLRKRRKWINRDKWERSLVKFISDYSQVDAWELEKYGYQAVRFAIKLKILKALLDCQFDFNTKFKSLINSQEASSLRILPIGRDIRGNLYWYQLDEMANIRVYREFIDDESTWTPVCKDKSDLIALIDKLKSETALEPVKEGSSGKMSSSESEAEQEDDEEEEHQEEDEPDECKDDISKSEQQQSPEPLLMETDDHHPVSIKIKPCKSESPAPQTQAHKSKKEASSQLVAAPLPSTLPPPPPLIKVAPPSIAKITSVKREPEYLSAGSSPPTESTSDVRECNDVHNCMSDLLDQVVKSEKPQSPSDQPSAAHQLPPPPLIPLPMPERKSPRTSSRNLRSNSSATTTCSLEELSPTKASRAKVEKVPPEETTESIVQSVCDKLIQQVLELMGEEETQSDRDATSSASRARGRGRSRGRRRKSRGASVSVSSANRSPANCTSKTTSSTRQRSNLTRELMDLNGLAEIELTALHNEAFNAANQDETSMDSAPRVRQSRRIAELQEKKTAELAEKLKREQERAEAEAVKRAELLKQCEAKRIAFQMSMQSGRKGARFKESSSECEEEKASSSSDDSFSSRNGRKRKRKGAKGRGRKGTKKNPYPWLHDGDTSEEAEEEEEEEEEIEDEVLKFDDNNEDEFACEEVEECAEPVVLRRARTAKKILSESESDDESSRGAHEDKSTVDDTVCRRCNKGTSPEWILLCDICDAGFHTSCLLPPLMIIPDGDWFCPPCENNMLISKLTERLAEIEILLEEQEKLAAKIAADREREEAKTARIRFVTVNEENIIPSDEDETGTRTHMRKKMKKQGYAESDPEDDELETTVNSCDNVNGQIDENGDRYTVPKSATKRQSGGTSRRKPYERKRRVNESSESGSESQSEDSSESKSDVSESESDEFPLRSARRCKKISYQFKEYDELIKSACRASGDEYEEEAVGENEAEDDDDDDSEDDSPNSSGLPHSLGKDMATIEAAFAAEQKELRAKNGQIVSDASIIVANVTIDGQQSATVPNENNPCNSSSQETCSSRPDAGPEKTDDSSPDDAAPKPKRGAPGIPATKKKPVKKRRALNDLDSPTDDDTSDESFKGSSDTEVEELSEAVTEDDSDATEDESDDSDFREHRRTSRRSHSRNNKRGNKNKSSKSRRRRDDDDFVDDDSDDDDYSGSRRTRVAAKKRKSYREISSETEEDEEWVSDASDKPKSKKTKTNRDSDNTESSDEEWGAKKAPGSKKKKKSWGASDDEDAADEQEKSSEDDDVDENVSDNSESPDNESDDESGSSDSSIVKLKRRKPPPVKKKPIAKKKGKNKKKPASRSPSKAKVRQTAATSRATAAATVTTTDTVAPSDATGEAVDAPKIAKAPKVPKEKPQRELRGTHARNAKARIISLKEEDDDDEEDEIEEKPVKSATSKRRTNTQPAEEKKDSDAAPDKSAHETAEIAPPQGQIQGPPMAPVSHLAAALAPPPACTTDTLSQSSSPSSLTTQPSVGSPMIVAALAGRPPISSPHVLHTGQHATPPHSVGPSGQMLPPQLPPGHYQSPYPPGHPLSQPHPMPPPHHQMYPGHPHPYRPPGPPGHLPPPHHLPSGLLPVSTLPMHRPGLPGHPSHPSHPGHPGHPPHPGHPGHPGNHGPLPPHVQPAGPPSADRPPVVPPAAAPTGAPTGSLPSGPPLPPPPPVSRASGGNGSSPLTALAAFASRDPSNNPSPTGPAAVPSAQGPHGPAASFANSGYPHHGPPLPPDASAHPVSRSSASPTSPAPSASGPSVARSEPDYTITSLDSYPRSKSKSNNPNAPVAGKSEASESSREPSYPPSSSPHRIISLDGPPPPHYSGLHSRPGGPAGPFSHPGHPGYDPKRMMHPGAMMPPGYPHPAHHGPSPYGPVAAGPPGHPPSSLPPRGPPPPGFPPNARAYFPPGHHPPPPGSHGYPPQGPPHPMDPYMLFPWWNNPNRMA